MYSCFTRVGVCEENDILTNISLSLLPNDDLFKYYASEFVYNNKLWSPAGDIQTNDGHYIQDINSNCKEYDVVESTASMASSGEILHWNYNVNDESENVNLHVYKVETAPYITALAGKMYNLESQYNASLLSMLVDGTLIIVDGVLLLVGNVAATPLFLLHSVLFIDNLESYMITNSLETYSQLTAYVLANDPELYQYDPYLEISIGEVDTLFEHYAQADESPNADLSIMQRFGAYSYFGNIENIDASPMAFEQIFEQFENSITDMPLYLHSR